MTKSTKGHDTHVKFDLRGEDFAVFKRTCKRENIAMAAVMRLFIVTWNEYVLSGEIDRDLGPILSLEVKREA